MKTQTLLVVGCMVINIALGLQAASVKISTTFANPAEGYALTCKHNKVGTFTANIGESPKDHGEWKIDKPTFLWSITPSSDNLSFESTTNETVNLQLTDNAFGIGYHIDLKVTWTETNTITGEKRNSDFAYALISFGAVKLVGLSVETPLMNKNMLCDNRTGAIQIAIEGCAKPQYLSFALSSRHLENAQIINKPLSTAISFFPTSVSTSWTTSTIYWYGTQPDHCCYTNNFSYEFKVVMNTCCSATHTRAVYMRDEGSVTFEALRTLASVVTVHDAVKISPGIYRCRIEFKDFEKIVGTPIISTDQYFAECSTEERYHVQQFKGTVSSSEGGIADCYTAKGIIYFSKKEGLTQIGSEWYGPVKTTPEDAKSAAITLAATGKNFEEVESDKVFVADIGLRESRAKAKAGYNAGWKYHCTYEKTCGLESLLKDTVNEAYKEGNP